MSEIGFILELFLSLSNFDVKGTKLGDALKLDCWIAKLDPFGGVKQLELILEYNADAWSASSIERYLDILERFAQTIATSAVEESS